MEKTGSFLRALQQNRAQSRLLYLLIFIIILSSPVHLHVWGRGGLFNLAKMVGGEFGQGCAAEVLRRPSNLTPFKTKKTCSFRDLFTGFVWILGGKKDFFKSFSKTEESSRIASIFPTRKDRRVSAKVTPPPAGYFRTFREGMCCWDP